MKLFFGKQSTPRWLIFLIDLSIVFFSVVLAYLLRFNFSIPPHELALLPRVMAVVLGVRTLSFLFFRTYAGIIRYTSTQDAMRIFLVVAGGSILFSLANVVFYYFISQTFIIPFSIIIIEFLAVIFAMITFRILVKIAWLELVNPAKEKRNVAIFGAGEAGIITKRALDRDTLTRYRVTAFVDDDIRKQGKKIEDVGIISSDKLEDLLGEGGVEQVIIAVQRLAPRRKQDIVELCLKHNTKVLSVPPVSTWIRGELNASQIKDIKIEDLLERDEIRLDVERTRKELRGCVVAITGAGGSIGSEIARQVAAYDPANLVLIDQAETPLFELQLELKEKYPGLKLTCFVGDICNVARMEAVFDTWKPVIVYHAAAYKHVPMMEMHPYEALHTNILGTKVLADLAVKHEVGKFIMISTDKAVNPTGVMGASKRIAELYVQALNSKGKTRFITTRFGNVLGSNGSAVNLFRRQIEKGGPVTVTHPDVTRFFMTIPEACQLVLEAGVMGKGGEIFLFDMGHPVKIVDLARKMINLSGFTPDNDIAIQFTGLRPGEKLYEELLAKEEDTLPTHHPLILVGKVREYDAGKVLQQIDDLTGMLASRDDMAIVAGMKAIVPEYKSSNSVFERLDEEAGNKRLYFGSDESDR
jgi:FlaA1/EpsC-like NDP-sugar epimerase